MAQTTGGGKIEMFLKHCHFSELDTKLGGFNIKVGT